MDNMFVSNHFSIEAEDFIRSLFVTRLTDKEIKDYVEEIKHLKRWSKENGLPAIFAGNGKHLIIKPDGEITEGVEVRRYSLRGKDEIISFEEFVKDHKDAVFYGGDVNTVLNILRREIQDLTIGDIDGVVDLRYEYGNLISVFSNGVTNSLGEFESAVVREDGVLIRLSGKVIPIRVNHTRNAKSMSEF